MVPIIIQITKAIDFVNRQIGRYVSWLILAAVLVSAVNAMVRKLFDSSSNAWLEVQWYLFGAVVFLSTAATLLKNEHIRIDVVSGLLPKQARNWIDLLGHAFWLLPFALIMTWTSWSFFDRSYALNEQSMNAGGLPLWPAKFLVFVGFVLLGLQGLSELIKRIAIMTGRITDSPAPTHHSISDPAAEL